MSFGLIFIEVCDANRAAQARLFDLEHRYPEVSVLESSCMSECELCAASPYVFFNGEMISAPTVDDLLAHVVERIEEIIHHT